ncbi:MAG: DedA family protein [Novosphingobium sp.]
MTVDTFIRSYGLLAVFAGCLFEGESFALAGGVAAHRGLLSLPSVIGAAFCGSLLTDQALFWFARTNRTRMLATRLARSAAFGRANRLIERYPNVYVLAFRFIYGIRLASPLAIGVSSVSGRRFLVLNFLAALLWAVTISSLGFAFSQAVELALGRIKAVEHVIALAALPAIIILLIFRRWIDRPGSENPS